MARSRDIRSLSCLNNIQTDPLTKSGFPFVTFVVFVVKK